MTFIAHRSRDILDISFFEGFDQVNFWVIMTFGVLHDVIKTITRWSLWSFYKEIIVIGGDNVPEDVPIIACCTHANMMIDPSVLATSFPKGRRMHYWVSKM